MYSRAAWPRDRDCGLVIGSRCGATFGFGPRAGWHTGLTAAFESIFQHTTAPPAAGGLVSSAWQPTVELIGTEGVLFLYSMGEHMDAFLHRGPWVPPGRLERVEAPARDIAPGPYAAAAAGVRQHVAMVEELVAAIEEGREHRSGGADARWALEMIHGTFESHRRGGARVPLPLAHRDHPLERWLNDEGRPLPPRPEVPAKVLRVPPALGQTTDAPRTT
jgi:hypothetical protein